MPIADRPEPSLAEPGPAEGAAARLPDEVAVKRSDPLYNAHAYLTKVPVTAIEPFLAAFTSPGDLVLDMYGGSGMTGVAAAMHGRRAEVRDISALGRHIGRNYLNLVDGEELLIAAGRVLAAARRRLGDVYATRCDLCGKDAILSRTVWSFVYECSGCAAPVDYHQALEAAEWKKKEMKCRACGEDFSARRSRRIAEEPVVDTISCPCSKALRDQVHTEPLHPLPADGPVAPDLAIGEDRQMFQSSALEKHGLTSTARFFSKRNLTVLATLREEIGEIEDPALRDKLLFAFTAILTRASKRYQWHPKRPLNAANQNYYVAPVFYEWNVYDLFERKVRAAARADGYLRDRMRALGTEELGKVRYEIGSADQIDLADGSVDYVFTDPPFGSNIFYSDMNLFQEAWLDDFTDHAQEAVVDRSGRGENHRSFERYEELIANSLEEASRVLREDGWLSIVFSNSDGRMWALLQRATLTAGFELKEVTLLNKGQRSVKGLASGFENVVTADLILSLRKTGSNAAREVVSAPADAVATTVAEALDDDGTATPSHVYLRVIRTYLRRHWNLVDLDMGTVSALIAAGYNVDAVSGRLRKASPKAA